MSSNVFNFTEKKHKFIITDNTKPLLIDYWGYRCCAFKMIEGTIKEIENSYSDKLKWVR